MIDAFGGLRDKKDEAEENIKVSPLFSCLRRASSLHLARALAIDLSLSRAFSFSPVLSPSLPPYITPSLPPSRLLPPSLPRTLYISPPSSLSRFTHPRSATRGHSSTSTIHAHVVISCSRTCRHARTTLQQTSCIGRAPGSTANPLYRRGVSCATWTASGWTRTASVSTAMFTSNTTQGKSNQSFC